MTIDLQIRDRYILHILAALGVARSLDLAFLAGFNNASYLRRRISFLQNCKLISSDYIGREKIYYLTSKGYLYTERYRNNYQINSQTIHDIGVTRICTYLYITQNLSYKDFLTDRQMFYIINGASAHRPDIVVEKTCYEYERTTKNYKLLLKNMLANQKFDEQVWILPASATRLKKKIPLLAKEYYMTNVRIESFDDIDAFVRSADLTKNRLITSAQRGKRQYDLLLQTEPNDTQFESFFKKGR